MNPLCLASGCGKVLLCLPGFNGVRAPAIVTIGACAALVAWIRDVCSVLNRSTSTFKFITENARHFRSNPTQTWPGSWQTRDTRWQRTSFPYRISCYVCALLILTDWCSTKTHSDPAITQPVLGSCGAKILHPTGLHTALTTRAHGFESRLGKRCRGERIGIATCRFLNRRLALLNSTPVTKQCR